MSTYMIVDDEPIAHRIIEDYAKTLPHLTLVNHSYNALEAMAFISANSVDLIFLDINMPKLKGFDLLRALNNPPKVIVTTAYEEYAIEGYELNVCDYLLKPFSFERFIKAVNKAVSSVETIEVAKIEAVTAASAPTPQNQKIFIKGDKKHHQIALADILFIEACGNYCVVKLKDGKLITHQKISQFEQDLPSGQFMRVHKSYLVAVYKIDALTASSITIQANQIPIGQTYKAAVGGLLG
jgi:DNA-binding LytR/AlgR family response regulator